MDTVKYNQNSWDKLVEKQDKWTTPVDEPTIAAARNGDWSVVLTPNKPVPRKWFPSKLSGKSVLCLASGGGQQGPILAAAGAIVTVLDNSPKQLEQDQNVAYRERLAITLELGDMKDLSRFEDEKFDVVFHPTSNCFIDTILPVWSEAYRVLKPGGTLLSGFANPIMYIFDLKAWNGGRLEIKHSIPYSDTKDLSEVDLKNLILESDDPVCFGHSLHDQIQGQIDVGFALMGFYEDKSNGGPLDAYIDSYIATKAVKLA